MRTNFKRIVSMCMALLISFSLLTTAFAVETGGNSTGATNDLVSFTDIKAGAWYYNDVMECAKLGIAAGFEDGSFKPDDSVTTIQMLTMMTRTFYSSKLEAIQQQDLTGKAWYYPYVTVANQVKMDSGLTIEDKPMDRYHMAVALYNTIDYENKTSGITNTQISNAVQSIKDFYRMPREYSTAVMYCYVLGILTGYDDGTFGGTGYMTRAQACTVIIRMMNLMNNDNPGDKGSGQYDNGTSQTPAQQETVKDISITSESTKTGTKWNIGDNQNQTGTLSNGKDITQENVMEILDMMHEQFPSGMVWSADLNTSNHYYGNPGRAVTNVVTKKYNVDTSYACGGFAAMVSDAVFGKNANPMRQVTDMSEIRPGDIVVQIYSATGKSSHISIITEVTADKLWYEASGNSGSEVRWYIDDKEAGTGNRISQLTTPGYFRYEVWTRYPDD